MKKHVIKSKAEGEVTIPSSKSYAHRLLIAAALCKDKTSIIRRITPSEDVLATIDCLSELGAKIEYDGDTATVIGFDPLTAEPKRPLNCRESGSTLRFLIPIAMLSGNKVEFIGTKRLMARSQDVYERLAREEGLLFTHEADKITVRGRLIAKEYFVDGNVSSQFISGMLFALSTLSGDSRIIINRRLESEPYVNMTISAMKDFGVRVYREDRYSFFTFGGQEYKAKDITVEGDWSAAAFMLALNHLGGKVKLCGLNESSLQGDSQCTRLFTLIDEGCPKIDLADCPDLAPIMFTMAAIKNGARFTGTKRLRDKESDRIATMQTELSKFGALITAEDDCVTVEKRELHAPSEPLYGHNDHRVVMSLTVISTLFGGEIDGCEAVKKSYPDFYKDIKALGIKVYEVN